MKFKRDLGIQIVLRCCFILLDFYFCFRFSLSMQIFTFFIFPLWFLWSKVFLNTLSSNVSDEALFLRPFINTGRKCMSRQYSKKLCGLAILFGLLPFCIIWIIHLCETWYTMYTIITHQVYSLILQRYALFLKICQGILLKNQKICNGAGHINSNIILAVIHKQFAHSMC